MPMEMVMVTLRDEGHTFAYDLELPYEMETERLIGQIAEALHAYNHNLTLSTDSKLYFPHERQLLRPWESLAQAGVHNGDYLVLVGGA